MFKGEIIFPQKLIVLWTTMKLTLSSLKLYWGIIKKATNEHESSRRETGNINICLIPKFMGQIAVFREYFWLDAGYFSNPLLPLPPLRLVSGNSWLVGLSWYSWLMCVWNKDAADKHVSLKFEVVFVSILAEDRLVPI